jgi:hypothetical protein
MINNQVGISPVELFLMDLNIAVNYVYGCELMDKWGIAIGGLESEGLQEICYIFDTYKKSVQISELMNVDTNLTFMIDHVLDSLAGDINIPKLILIDSIYTFLESESHDENVRKDFFIDENQTVDVHKLCELVSKIEQHEQLNNNDEEIIKMAKAHKQAILMQSFLPLQHRYFPEVPSIDLVAFETYSQLFYILILREFENLDENNLINGKEIGDVKTSTLTKKTKIYVGDLWDGRFLATVYYFYCNISNYSDFDNENVRKFLFYTP